jgi:peroxiredoxin
MKSLGAELVAVSPQLPEFSRQLVEQKKLSFDLLSDPGNKVAEAYGLVFSMSEDLAKIYLKFEIDVAKHNGDDSWTLPIPARFIVDRNRTIRYAEVYPDYTIRPEPSHTIEALKSI